MDWDDATGRSNTGRIGGVRQGHRAPSTTLGFCSLASMGGPILSWALHHANSSVKAVRVSVTGSSVPARVGIPGFQDIEATGNCLSGGFLTGTGSSLFDQKRVGPETETLLCNQ